MQDAGIGEAARGVNGQIIGVRGNMVYLYNQRRPIRTLHERDGWTAGRLAARLPDAWGEAFVPLEHFQDVSCWPPI